MIVCQSERAPPCEKRSETGEIVLRADVGGVLVAPRLLACRELRGERATYTNLAAENWFSET